MKNKTKKILACATLGLVGMGCVTGCSMSEEQKKALDLITEKSDKIINLLEDNMEYNNKNLSKEEAAEKILIGRNVFKFANFNEFEMSMIQNEYDGVFDTLVNSYTPDPEVPYVWKYKKSGDTKIFATIGDNELNDICISNFATDEHLYWGKNDVTFKNRVYQTDDFIFDHFDSFLSGFVATEITSSHIKDIVITEDGYEFSTFVNSPSMAIDTEVESRFNVSFDGYITKWICKGVKNISNDYESFYIEFNFKYDNVDFGNIDAKISQLTNQN